MANKKLMEMTEDELMEFWDRHRSQSRKAAESLVGKRPGYVKLANKLAAIACNRSVQLACERRGDALAASVYGSHIRIALEDVPEDVVRKVVR